MTSRIRLRIKGKQETWRWELAFQKGQARSFMVLGEGALLECLELPFRVMFLGGRVE